MLRHSVTGLTSSLAFLILLFGTSHYASAVGSARADALDTPSSARAGAADPAVVVPLRLETSYPLIEARLEGLERPVRLIVDTAAGGTVLSETLTNQLGLRSEERVQVRGATSTTNTHFARRVRLSLGEFTFDVAPVVHAIPDDEDGILGNDILRNVDVRFDYAAGKLELAPAGQHPAWFASPRCTRTVPGPRSSEFPLTGFAFLDGQLQRQDRAMPLLALLDTGAAQSVLNLAGAKALGVDLQSLRKRDRGTRGLGDGVADTWLLPTDGIRIGDWTSGPLEIRVSDLAVFKSLRLQERPTIILGSDALRRSRVTLGDGMRTVCLEQAA